MTTSPKKNARRRRSRHIPARIFIALHLACVLLPIALIVVWAFTERWAWPSLLPESFSARGIAEIFTYSQGLLDTLVLSVLIAALTALLSTLIAALAARALALYRFPGRSFAQAATILPFIIPSTVFAMGVQIAFIKLGLSGTVVGVVIAHTVIALPYSIMLLVDVTAACGTRLEEQARSLGAGVFATLRHVTVPQLLPGILSSLSMAYILSFSQYFITLLVGGGQVKTFAMAMFPFLASGDRTVAAAYGVVFLVVSLAVFVLFEILLHRHMKREVGYYS